MQGLNSGDTAWMLVSAAMVLFMTPGLAAFYSGMVRKKNVLSTTMHSVFAMGTVSIIWALFGYSLAFSDGSGALAPFIGGLNYVGLSGIATQVAPLATTIPHTVYVMYQGMFAIITVALITGAVAERMKFKAYVMFTVLWAIFVYSPLAHWVWQPNGWLFKMGALDFAGGTVVHINAGIAGLVGAYVMVRNESFERMDSLLDSYRMQGYGQGYLTVRSIKRQIDGALGSRGAWLLEPYRDLPGSYGLNTTKPAEISETARIALAHGLQLCVHAIGDRANRETLDIFEAARRAHQDDRRRPPHARRRGGNGHEQADRRAAPDHLGDRGGRRTGADARAGGGHGDPAGRPQPVDAPHPGRRPGRDLRRRAGIARPVAGRAPSATPARLTGRTNPSSDTDTEQTTRPWISDSRASSRASRTGSRTRA